MQIWQKSNQLKLIKILIYFIEFEMIKKMCRPIVMTQPGVAALKLIGTMAAKLIFNIEIICSQFPAEAMKRVEANSSRKEKIIF